MGRTGNNQICGWEKDEPERRINIVGEMDNITKLTVGIKGKPEGGKRGKRDEWGTMDGETGKTGRGYL